MTQQKWTELVAGFPPHGTLVNVITLYGRRMAAEIGAPLHPRTIAWFLPDGESYVEARAGDLWAPFPEAT